MNRDDLDAFFAKADDVLTDWYGGTDSMHGSAPEPGTEDDLTPPADSYYAQDRSGVLELTIWDDLVRAYEEALIYITNPITPLGIITTSEAAGDWVVRGFRGGRVAWFDECRQPDAPAVRVGHPAETDETPAERALRLRRTRNTGPDDPYRFTRRRSA